MAIGMTYEQYWYGDPLMVRAFYKAHKVRLQMQNEQAWLNGVYVVKALDAVVGNMFRKSGAKASEYPEKPFELFADENKTKEEKEDADAMKAKAYMASMVQAGKNWGKK